MSNSIKAIENLDGSREGRIQITGGYVTAGDIDNKNDVYISWLDNGIGIDSDKISKLFDPFFTTDEFEQGVGLGMSIAKQIIDKHEGRMEITSAKNQWTRINIFLNIA